MTAHCYFKVKVIEAKIFAYGANACLFSTDFVPEAELASIQDEYRPANKECPKKHLDHVHSSHVIKPGKLRRRASFPGMVSLGSALKNE